MLQAYIVILVAGPFVAALLCALVRVAFVRNLIVATLGALLSLCAFLLLYHGPFAYSFTTIFGIPEHYLVLAADDILLLTMLYFAWKYKRWWLAGLILSQIVALDSFEHFMVDHSQPVTVFAADRLSLIMVVIISVVGSLICLFAIPYMEEHERHQGVERSRQPEFFAFLIMILGAMNGLVISNHIVFLYLFFEVTTLGSFMLIRHDRTETAIQNALRALWMNCLAGAACIAAMIWAYALQGTVDLQAMIEAGHLGGMMLTPLALLCFAGLVKAAQIPFQSWLLGAMVAPTPTSALLHSSTMVKAGVYMALRFAPGFAGTFLSECLAVVGAFTFAATSFLALTQSNGKRILAYSTIGNLGLMVACVGINTTQALAAAILLLIFHAFSKGLLFLCIGHIEQRIGSRDVEDMRGLIVRMPWTTWIIFAGILTMMLPPFGVLLTKWMATEAAAGHLFVILLIALGSPAMVLYWTRWAGILLSAAPGEPARARPAPMLTRIPLYALVAGAVILSLLAPLLYTRWIGPYLGVPDFAIQWGGFASHEGGFALYPIVFCFSLLGLLALMAARRASRQGFAAPYICGASPSGPQSFVGPMNKEVVLGAGNVYFSPLFQEEKATRWINLAGAILLALLIGGAL